MLGTASRGDPAVFSLLPPLAVPLLLEPRVRVQAEVLEPGPPLGTGELQQRVRPLVQQVEQVQLHRYILDQPRGRPPGPAAGAISAGWRASYQG